MALIKCPECKAKVSDAADGCPKCGKPLSAEEKARIRKKEANKWGIFTIVMAIFALWWYFGDSTPDEGKNGASSQSSQARSSQPKKTFTPMTAAQLWKEFSDNEVAAERKYKGKQVAVEGRIHAIESSLMGYPEIVFNVSYGLDTVRCQFSKRHSEEIAGLRKGQSVMVIGTVEFFVLGSVSIENCTFAERVE